MRVILLSCLLYLLGVVLVLYLKPTLMFNKKGIWKEFGFTNDEEHTWFPFWLFCILWAFISFFVVNYAFGERPVTVSSFKGDNEVLPVENAKKIKSKKSNIQAGNDARPGYYMLDKEGSEREGFPKYVYLGPNMPSDNRDEY
jgi:hypothetical protein